MRNAKDRAERLFARERTADAALSVLAVMLCGWLVYCLANAFQNSTFLM
jgi:hypothetical protein